MRECGFQGKTVPCDDQLNRPFCRCSYILVDNEGVCTTYAIVLSDHVCRECGQYVYIRCILLSCRVQFLELNRAFVLSSNEVEIIWWVLQPLVERSDEVGRRSKLPFANSVVSKMMLSFLKPLERFMVAPATVLDGSRDKDRFILSGPYTGGTFELQDNCTPASLMFVKELTSNVHRLEELEFSLQKESYPFLIYFDTVTTFKAAVELASRHSQSWLARVPKWIVISGLELYSREIGYGCGWLSVKAVQEIW